MATLSEMFAADLEEVGVGEKEEDEMVVDEKNVVSLKSAKDVSVLRESETLRWVLSEISTRDVKNPTSSNPTPSELAVKLQTTVEEDPEYKLMISASEVARRIEEDVAKIVTLIHDRYKQKFPELKNIVSTPLEYVKIVQRIGNATDVSNIALDDIGLPPMTVLVVSTSASRMLDYDFSGAELAMILEACEEVVFLEESKLVVLEFVASRMMFVAPNLTYLLGPMVSAQLVSLAGGLDALSKLPSCVVQALGIRQRQLEGMSALVTMPHTGVVLNAEIVRSAPPSLRKRAVHEVASKCALCARADAFRMDNSSAFGEKVQAAIVAKIEKWQEPPPARQPKPLPAPDVIRQKKHRGGKRVRRLKERTQMTDMMKAAYRVQFGTPDDTDLMTGESYGMLRSKEKTGRLRMAPKDSQKLAKAAARRLQKSKSTSKDTSGLSSSIAFTPVQGIELENPLVAKQTREQKKPVSSQYFSGFQTFKAPKPE